MNEVILAVALLPVFLDLALQIFIHIRTMKKVHGCPYCPYCQEGEKDESGERILE